MPNIILGINTKGGKGITRKSDWVRYDQIVLCYENDHKDKKYIKGHAPW